jgi:transposase
MLRKRSDGIQSDKGDRWAERILSRRQTCRGCGLPVFPILVNVIRCFFKERQPDLCWIGRPLFGDLLNNYHSPN